MVSIGPTGVVGTSSPDHVVLERPAALGELAGLRTALRAWLSHRAMHGDTADQLLVVLSEIVTNAIEASPPQSTITVSWSLDADSVRLGVDDSGPGFSYERTEPVGAAAARGRGLTFVEAFSDRIKVTHERQCTSVVTWTRIARPLP